MPAPQGRVADQRGHARRGRVPGLGPVRLRRARRPAGAVRGAASSASWPSASRAAPTSSRSRSSACASSSPRACRGTSSSNRLTAERAAPRRRRRGGGAALVPGRRRPTTCGRRHRAAGRAEPAAPSGAGTRRPEQVEAMRVPQAVTERSFALIARLLSGADVAGDGTLVLDGAAADLRAGARARSGCSGPRRAARARPPIVSGGAQAAEPHEHGHGAAAGRRVDHLRPLPAQRRATASTRDMTRTFCVGDPPRAAGRAARRRWSGRCRTRCGDRAGRAGPGVRPPGLGLLLRRGLPHAAAPGGEHGREGRPATSTGSGHGLGLDVHEAARASGRPAATRSSRATS